jgi:hypothetical protein
MEDFATAQCAVSVKQFAQKKISVNFIARMDLRVSCQFFWLHLREPDGPFYLYLLTIEAEFRFKEMQAQATKTGE